MWIKETTSKGIPVPIPDSFFVAVVVLISWSILIKGIQIGIVNILLPFDYVIVMLSMLVYRRRSTAMYLIISGSNYIKVVKRLIQAIRIASLHLVCII